jgi:site-specific recombinase XerD
MKFSNWTLAPSKYLTGKEAAKLLSIARHRAEVHNSKVAVRDYFIIHLALATGLRVMEIAALKCGDVFLDDNVCSFFVRKGKGNKKRQVFFTCAFERHCKEYLRWKQRVGESIEPEKPLIVSSNTGEHMTTRAMQKVFKRCAERACLYSVYSIHCLRHTYACFLLKASDWNLRLVQKQLGHSRVSTTQVYADVMIPDVKKALDKLHRMNSLI